MGFLERLRFAGDVLAPSASAELTVLPPVSGDVAQVSHLPAGVAQAFGINTTTDKVSRDQAMTVPAVRRGRQVIAGTLGTAPLVCVRERAGKAPERVVRPLLVQPDPNVTCAFTLTWTVDDLLFYGVAWWRVLARASDGFPSQAERVAPHRVAIDTATGRVRIDGVTVADRDLIRFDGPDEGILKHGSRVLKTSLLLEEAVRRYARLDIPLGFLVDSEGAMTTVEVQAFLDAWESARVARTTGYLPHGLDYKNPTFNAEQVQLGDARSFQAAEIARLMNLPASAVNAPTGDSLTYSTTESNRRELVDLTHAPFIAAIEQRLSMPDATPAGTKVRVDLSRFIRGDLKAVIETGAAAVTAGLMSVDEVRTQWLDLPPLTAQEGPTDD